LKFDEFWALLSTELVIPKQFSTQTKTFFAKYNGGIIHVTTSDDFLWTIDRPTFRQIWNKALLMHEKMRFIHSNYAHENIRTSAYILAIIKHYTDENKME